MEWRGLLDLDTYELHLGDEKVLKDFIDAW